MYLCGSLALGDFDPAKSDGDVLVVTEIPLSDAEIDVLAGVHERVPPSYAVPGRDYEVYYIDRATLRRFAPGQRHVKIEPGEPLCRTEHRPGWVIERWVVRERGVTLAGPDPKSLIDPVSADELRWAAGEELRARLTNWSGGRWPITEMAHLGAQSFEVATACRALHTGRDGPALIETRGGRVGARSAAGALVRADRVVAAAQERADAGSLESAGSAGVPEVSGGGDADRLAERCRAAR